MGLLDAENAAYSGALGEDWTLSLTRTSGTSVYANDLVVKLWTTDQTPSLVATSGTPPSGVVQILTTGSDPTGDPVVFRMVIAKANTTAANFPPGEYRMEMWVTQDSKFRRILNHDWQVLP